MTGEPEKLPYKAIDNAYLRGIGFGVCCAMLGVAWSNGAWFGVALALAGALAFEWRQFRFELRHTEKDSSGG